MAKRIGIYKFKRSIKQASKHTSVEELQMPIHSILIEEKKYKLHMLFLSAAVLCKHISFTHTKNIGSCAN